MSINLFFLFLLLLLNVIHLLQQEQEHKVPRPNLLAKLQKIIGLAYHFPSENHVKDLPPRIFYIICSTI